MAGNYPDVSSWRMAWDVDGTQVMSTFNGDEITSYGSSVNAGLNNESGSTWLDARTAAGMSSSGGNYTYGNSHTGRIMWIFPELRDLDGLMWSEVNAGSSGPPAGSSTFSVQVSSDTTNGLDGTWVTYLGSGSIWNTYFTKPGLRTLVYWSSALGIKGIRFTGHDSPPRTHYVSNTHFFGEPAPGENLQRLEIWHPTLDQRLGPADLDWGDVPRNSTETRGFRIKNMHPTLTANGVRAAMSILSDTSPSVMGQQAISQDGGATWGAQQTLSSPLGPEAISPVLQLRRQTPANATLSLWWYRVFADCSSWT